MSAVVDRDTGEILAPAVFERADATKTALVLPDELTYDEWRQVGDQLRMIEGSVMWWIGDWLNYGEKRYGETYSEALDATGYDYGTLRDAKWVAGKYEMSDRSDILSWLHHRVALGSDDPVEALSWAKQNAASAKDLRQHLRRAKIQSIGSDFSATTPRGQYHVIVIDPPWRYDGGEMAHDPDAFRGVVDYPTMAIDEIADIELPAADDCILWLWTTHRFMRHAITLVDQWGFEEKAILTWVKNRMGIGRWLRSQTEFCVMAVKGGPPVNLTNQTTVMNAPLREHSRKPDEFYDMVDELCVGRKLDYFSRQSRDGWDQYGNDAERF